VTYHVNIYNYLQQTNVVQERQVIRSILIKNNVNL